MRTECFDDALNDAIEECVNGPMRAGINAAVVERGVAPPPSAK